MEDKRMTMATWDPGTLADEVLYPGQMAMPHKGIHALIKYAIGEGELPYARWLESAEVAQQVADDAIANMVGRKS